ncbi:TRAP transporter fused permease subunit [Deferrisoma sp.]
MAEELKTAEDVSPEEKAKLKELLEKDAKSARPVTGSWRWIVSALGAIMVVFYFYTAGITSVATQYHRGVYVFITYVLIFLLYPAGKTWVRGVLSLFLGVVVSCAAAILFFYPVEMGVGAKMAEVIAAAFSGPIWDALSNGFTKAVELWLPDVIAFHERLMAVYREGWGQAVGLWPLAAGSLAAAAGIWVCDGWMIRRRPQNPSLSDILLALCSAAVVYYWIHEFEVLNYRAGAENELDALVSVVGVILSLEVCRRVLGWAMTLIGIGALCYGYFGPFFPDIIAHRGFGFERLCTALYLTTNGVFGVMANVLATYVILFIFFGAFLHASGAGRFFIDLPMALAGRTTGGPAKVAVIASALFGSVSGSAIANTVSTGAFTIPLMKRAGFRPHVAGAIEPAASIGGMFMPPIMGAGGFLMAELTETPYAHIMAIAVAPALLYFLSVFCMIHFEAKKQGITGVAGEHLEHWTVVLKREWYFSLPLIIITVLMIMGRSPGYAAFWATLSCIAVSWVRKETRMGPREIWNAILTGANNTLIIGATVGVIGIIVGTISLTGIGLKFSDIIISLAGGNLLPAILLVGLASLVLGMGVPVTAAYLITAVLAVPPLTEMGVVLIAAHMIVYWFSQDSNITPPVCVAAYAGAAIAGADPWKTGWTSFKFAKLLYVMPLLFAYTPAILFEGKPIVAPQWDDDLMGAMVTTVKVKVGDPFEKGDVIAEVLDGEQVKQIVAQRDGIIKDLKIRPGQHIDGGIVVAETRAKPFAIFSSILSATLGTIAFSALTMFYLIRKTNPLEWILLAVATVLLYWPTFLTDAVGLVLVALVYLSQKARNRRDAARAAAAPA